MQHHFISSENPSCSSLSVMLADAAETAVNQFWFSVLPFPAHEMRSGKPMKLHHSPPNSSCSCCLTNTKAISSWPLAAQARLQPAAAMSVGDSPKWVDAGGPSIRIPVQSGRKGGVPLRKQRVESRLATLDTDGDGVIDRKELVSVHVSQIIQALCAKATASIALSKPIC